jgi:hypothetical protein
MKEVHYSRARLLQAGIGCPILAVLGLWAGGRADGFAALVLFVSAIALFVVAPVALIKANGDRVALRYDNRNLEIATLWSRRSVTWSEVVEVGTETLSFSTFFGFIKTNSANYLVVKLAGGLIGSKKVRLVTGLLDLTGTSLQDLVAELSLARAGNNPLQATAPSTWTHNAPQSSDPLEGGPRSTEFDPDAAIARYLANREPSAQLVPSAPARPAFGRKGL